MRIHYLAASDGGFSGRERRAGDRAFHRRVTLPQAVGSDPGNPVAIKVLILLAEADILPLDLFTAFQFRISVG